MFKPSLNSTSKKNMMLTCNNNEDKRNQFLPLRGKLSCAVTKHQEMYNNKAITKIIINPR